MEELLCSLSINNILGRSMIAGDIGGVAMCAVYGVADDWDAHDLVVLHCR